MKNWCLKVVEEIFILDDKDAIIGYLSLVETSNILEVIDFIETS